jgi:hypothetical protein
MTLRETLNLWAFVLFLLFLVALSMVVQELANHERIAFYEAMFLVLTVAPGLLMIITGEAYGITFFTNLIWNHTGAARNHYSLERSKAREGKGREAAHGILWRDTLIGDTPGLFAVLEMARLDDGMRAEALRATHRLLARTRLSKADRDHAGRLAALLKLSVGTDAAPRP